MDIIGVSALGWAGLGAAAFGLFAAGWSLARRGPRAGAGARVLASAKPATDELTGLPTRERFEEMLDDAALACDRQAKSLVLVFIDLDNLRLVNDAYGHATGDRLLAQVPQRLRAALPHALAVTRWAGDEFALLTPGDAQTAQAHARTLRQRLREPFLVNGQELRIDASVGLALYPSHGSANRLPTLAATAMRSVKLAGGSGHAMFEPAMAVDMRHRAELLRALRQAVEGGRLQLVFQPKIDAASLKVTAAEALLRWHDPAHGVVPPSVFIPLAEENGLMMDVGRWVIEEACRQAAQWRAKGLRMRLAINVSGLQLRTPDWVDQLRNALAAHGLSARRFTCEITESVAMENTPVTRSAFERLRELGVHVSIDDFGTGHSNLTTLRQLPAAELKIDRSFVTDMTTNPQAQAIVSSIVRMAHGLQLRVVAEGVETEAQRDALQRLGCDELQGFLFAKPMSGQALALWAESGSVPSGLGFRASLFLDTAALPDAVP